jgi:transcriptional regulator with XRE-family HTH domain
VSQATISRIESERESPSADLLSRLVEACGMELVVVERPGRGVDRSLIRALLEVSPRTRARDTARGPEVLEPLQRAGQAS